MAAGAYNQARKVALRLIGTKGVTVTLTRERGAINEITGQRGSGTLTASYKAVRLPPGQSAAKDLGKLVNHRMGEFHMARLSGAIEPEPGDKLTMSGVDWTVIWSAVYDPDDTGLVYTKVYGER
jgi:hypothetical protein